MKYISVFLAKQQIINQKQIGRSTIPNSQFATKNIKLTKQNPQPEQPPENSITHNSPPKTEQLLSISQQIINASLAAEKGLAV